MSMHICRTRFKRDIICEFVPPKNKNSRKVMIFCSGIPSVPCKDDLLEFWAKKGYWTFFPRYRGSWESRGTFLKRSLELDVFDVIEAMQKRFKDFWNKDYYRVKPQKIYIVGSSFGGPAAILATLDPRVDKVICISPVVDWIEENKAEPLDVLYKFLREAYGGVYHLNKRYWNRLLNGRFYNPARHIQKLDGHKILIFHAKDDDIVKYKPVAKFAQKTGSRLVTLKKGGHLSSSMLMEDRHYKRATQFLRF